MVYHEDLVATPDIPSRNGYGVGVALSGCDGPGADGRAEGGAAVRGDLCWATGRI